MKLLTVLLAPIFCLEFGIFVSSQSLSEALYELINIDKESQTNANSKILKQYNDALAEINKELYNTILPTLNKTSADIGNHVRELDNQLTSSGYNFTSCIELVEESFNNISSIASITNVTAKAIEEKEKVYDRILNTIYLIGRNNIDVIHDEMENTYYEYIFCISSEYPQYCNATLNSKIIAKQQEIPKIYNKEVEMTNTNLIQQVLIYKNRVQDYVNELIKTAKPYMFLYEIAESKWEYQNKGN